MVDIFSKKDKRDDDESSRDDNSSFLLNAEVTEQAFVMRMSICAPQQRFCRKLNGHLGWVPLGTEVGDQICVLYGGEVLYVLRPEANEQYRLIGEAFIHGLMSGEAITAAGSDDRDSRIC